MNIYKFALRLFLILLFSLQLVSNSLGQSQKLDKKYYLLGTLDDYLGRQKSKLNPTRWSYIMTLYNERLGEIKRIEKVTHKKFSKRKARKDCSNCQDLYDLKSTILACRINKFYSFKKDDHYRDNFGLRMFTGNLICDKILKANEKQQLSFIAGVFLTNGEKEGELYKIALYNSSARFECIKKILIKLGAEITKDEIVRNIPVGFFIVFKPTDKLKAIIETEIKEEYLYSNPNH